MDEIHKMFSDAKYIDASNHEKRGTYDLDDMRAASEWDEALIKHKIKDAPQREMTVDEAQLLDQEVMAEAKARMKYDKTETEMAEHEDDIEEKELRLMRAKRVAAMKAARLKNKFGAVFHIQEQDYKCEVTEAAEQAGVWVVCHLYSVKDECDLLNRHMDTLAKKFKAVKFVKIKSTQAIPNYPDSKTPTLLLYTQGDIAQTLVGPGLFGGRGMTAGSLEFGLGNMGVLDTDIEENPIKRQGMNGMNMTRAVKGQARKGHLVEDSEDSDSDFN